MGLAATEERPLIRRALRSVRCKRAQGRTYVHLRVGALAECFYAREF